MAAIVTRKTKKMSAEVITESHDVTVRWLGFTSSKGLQLLSKVAMWAQARQVRRWKELLGSWSCGGRSR